MSTALTLKKGFLWLVIISLVIAAFMGIYAVLVGDFGDLEAKILMTNVAMGGFSLTALSTAIWFEKWRFIPVAHGGVISSIVGFLFSVLMIWEVIDFNIDSSDEWILKAWLIATILSAAFAHSSLLLLMYDRKRIVNILLALTVMLIAILAILLITLIIFEFEPEDIFFRSLLAMGILIVLGTLVSPIILKTSNLKR